LTEVVMNASNETKYLSTEDKQELLEVMDAHFKTYLRARSLTPT
jgi:recombinational DNA repair protein (RecF pathway)